MGRLKHSGQGNTVDARAAEEFLRLHYDENPGDLRSRLREMRRELEVTGTYVHTPAELEFGARVAWRNSARCIGRLYWRSLRVRDRRDVYAAEAVAKECSEHLRQATGRVRRGRIRPTITVFPPDTPGRRGPRIWNEQLIRYADDPRYWDFTALARHLGWRRTGRRFEILPLIIQSPADLVRVFELPGDVILEVPLRHPRHSWFADLGLRWHAVPVLSSMCLEIGGICYRCAPFNGWYMGTEIGARNLGDSDRYDQCPAVASRLGLDTSDERTLWRDQALVELNAAVLHSFDTDGVTITDHHTESRRFLTHLAKEEAAGRVCPADWSWIVPPISGSATPVFHRYYDDVRLAPAFISHPESQALALGRLML